MGGTVAWWGKARTLGDGNPRRAPRPLNPVLPGTE